MPPLEREWRSTHPISRVSVPPGFAVAPVRKRLFKKVFYEKNFPELLKDRTVPLPELGYGRATREQMSRTNGEHWTHVFFSLSLSAATRTWALVSSARS